ncbi:P-loop containing nucleoside triphosphate hydrolase protein [Violaceomyces palustris]|uniref:P-loop containing nucleoside triphosphate hydrolase protein n=1 Tax=Violaceomyces palustris TaxID=1673888 RepID=A0ACD0P8V7_9BASI|nr:P-loop containing nucleoside triphosphate hydrolase protein [Violaceomyces palustris]
MAGPPVRVRYNAKARQSTAGGSTHKKKKSAKVRNADAIDSNTQMIVPGSEEDLRRKEQERLRKELLAASGRDQDGPVSSKKRKRLDAYIESRLKKEERAKIMAKLAETSREISDRTELVSAATLGTGRALTGAERIEHGSRNEDTGIKGRRRRKQMKGEVMRIEEDDLDADLDRDEEESDQDFSEPEMIDEPVGEVEEDPERRARIIAAASAFNKPEDAPSSDPSVGSALATTQLGSALAKGANGKPLEMKMRARKKRTRVSGSGTSWGRLSSARTVAKASEDTDSSFDSSESSGVDDDEEEDEGAKKPHVSGSKISTKVTRITDPSARIDMEINEDDEEDDDDDDEGHDDEEERKGDDDVGSETDEEENAVLLEAMRRRGLIPSVEAVDGSSDDDEDEDEAEERSASPAWEGFPDEEATEENDVVLKDDEEEEEELGYDDEDSEEDDDDDDDDDEDQSDEGEDENEDGDEDEAGETRSKRRGIRMTKRSAGFKDWARSALGMAGDGSGNGEDDHSYNLEPVGGLKLRVGDLGPSDGINRGPLGEDEAPASEKSPFAAKHYAEQQESKDAEQLSDPKAKAAAAKIRNVLVERSEDIQVARLKLPVVAEEDNIVKTILENPVTVLCGETGSGKTTQVPQFLYEAGFGTKGSHNPGMIGVTQPRRVAAVSMAQRIAHELNLPDTKVSHQIRYDATVSPHTAIKFMTDGVLLRELATDFLLTKYSAVLIDEAHERSVNTDVLIGVLSRVARLREQRWLKGEKDARPLRLVIMSATLRVSDFTLNKTLFPTPPPVINIGARQHPVTIHFNRKTVQDYISEATKKATKIHARLPPGGILIFLTGQQEISTVCRRLEKRFGRRAIEQRKRERARAQAGRRSERSRTGYDDEDGGIDETKGDKIGLASKDGDVEAEEIDLGISKDLALDVDDGDAADDEVDAEALDTDEEEEESKRHDADLPPELQDDSDVPMHILPLYSLLPSDKQMRIFEEPPLDSRLVVVSTNVAETSLTIPNIKYVIDCGRCKERKYDLNSGVQSYEVSWVSKASASQRAGRAGRTGPGHCYRLYSSAVYEDHFKEFSSPEILRTPVDGLVLSMKAMNIDNVSNFPFPTAPDRTAIRKAERVLTYLGALESPQTVAIGGGKGQHARITELGRAMTLFPVSPRFAKLLAQGQQHGCLPYVVVLVAALSIGDPFVREQALEDGDGHGDDDDEGEEGGRDGRSQKKRRQDEEDEELPLEMKNLKNKELLEKERRKAKRARYFKTMKRFEALGAGLSDTFRLLSVVGAYEYEGGGSAFCERNFLRLKAMEEIHKLRAQLCNLVSSNVPALSQALANPKLTPPNETQLKVLRQLIAAAFVDQVAVRADLVSSGPGPGAGTMAGSSGNQSKNRGAAGDKMASTRGVAYKAMGVPGLAYIHPSSSFYHSQPPQWVVFTEVHKSASKFATGETTVDPITGASVPTAGEGTLWLKTLTRINPAWLSTLGKSLCTFSKPIEIPQASSSGVGGSSIASLSASAKALKSSSSSSNQAVTEVTRQVLLTPTYGAGMDVDQGGVGTGSGGLGWELPPIKATQRLVKGRWVTNIV